MFDSRMNQPGFNSWTCPQEEADPEEDLRRRRIEAYLRGEILNPSEVDGIKEHSENDEPAVAAEKLFTDEELQEWTGERAVSWISKARNAFEVLGVSMSSQTDAASMRVRYRRLSLLVHPDKNPHGDASACFQRLSEALRVLFDDVERQQLLDQLWEEEAKPRSFQASAEPDEPPEEVTEEGMNESVHERVLQHGKLQQLLKQRKGKRSRSPARGPRTGGRQSLTEQWQRMAAAAAPTVAAASCPQDLGQMDPQSLWQQGGDSALELTGWRRLESRRLRGQFYFAHLATGRTIMDSLSPSQTQGSTWERRQSRHDPSVHYYVNLATGETKMESAPPERNYTLLLRRPCGRLLRTTERLLLLQI